ncbi:thrombospondin type 3 repeat-containing protein [Pyxidicoccus sp. 3LG]
MKRLGMILTGLCALLMANPAKAICKLVINVDRTASMLTVRADGKTRCQSSQESVLAILDAYYRGMDFDITRPELGAIPRAEYDIHCPAGPDYRATAKDRLVQVREFHGDTMAAVAVAGFLPVDYVIPRIARLPWYDAATGRSLNQCPGNSTPMAQAMCRVARLFPQTVPPGEFRIVKTTTDGQENSSTTVPLNANEARCRLPNEPELTWRTRVMDEYTSRSIAADAVLWGVGGSTSLRDESPETREHGATDAVEPRAFANLAESPDYEFFWSMALSTGGTFQFVDQATVLSPVVTHADSDGDGIPDFRDQCSGACAADADQDGIPDAADLCPQLAEDGRLANRVDGCPDSDSDGVHNGVDACPQALEDSLEPFPNDSCPAERWSAGRTLNLPVTGGTTVCTSLDVISRTGAASLARFSISGQHRDGRYLSGTVTHNGTTVVAFPAGTFNTAASGFFQASNLPLSMPPGAAAGTWTLCITDSNLSGYSGGIGSWGVSG